MVFEIKTDLEHHCVLEMNENLIQQEDIGSETKAEIQLVSYSLSIKYRIRQRA